MTEFGDINHRSEDASRSGDASLGNSPNTAALQLILDKEPLSSPAGLLALLRVVDYQRLIQNHPGREVLTNVLKQQQRSLANFTSHIESAPDVTADLRQRWYSSSLALDFVLDSGAADPIMKSYSRGLSHNSRRDLSAQALASVDTHMFLLLSVLSRGQLGDLRARGVIRAASVGVSQVLENQDELSPFASCYARWAELLARPASWYGLPTGEGMLSVLVNDAIELAFDVRALDLPDDDFLRMQRNVEVHAAALTESHFIYRPWMYDEISIRYWADGMQHVLEKSEPLLSMFVLPDASGEVLIEPGYDEILLRSFLGQSLVFLGEWRAAARHLGFVREFIDRHMDATGTSDVRQQIYFPIISGEMESALMVRTLALQTVVDVMLGGSEAEAQKQLNTLAMGVSESAGSELPAADRVLHCWVDILAYLNMAGWGCLARGDKAVHSLLSDLAAPHERRYFDIDPNAQWAWSAKG